MGPSDSRESPVALALLHDTARHFGGFNPAQAVPKRSIQRAFGLALIPYRFLRAGGVACPVARAGWRRRFTSTRASLPG